MISSSFSYEKRVDSALFFLIQADFFAANKQFPACCGVHCTSFLISFCCSDTFVHTIFCPCPWSVSTVSTIFFFSYPKASFPSLLVEGTCSLSCSLSICTHRSAFKGANWNHLLPLCFVQDTTSCLFLSLSGRPEWSARVVSPSGQSRWWGASFCHVQPSQIESIRHRWRWVPVRSRRRKRRRMEVVLESSSEFDARFKFMSWLNRHF